MILPGTNWETGLSLKARRERACAKREQILTLIKALLTSSSDNTTGQIHKEVEKRIGGIKISERTFRNYVKVLADRGEIIRKRSGKGQRGWTQFLRLN